MATLQKTLAESLSELLTNIRLVHEKHKELSILHGENFNIFRLIKIEASEVRLHSTFLAELLSPKGTHGFKDRFLNLFVTQLFIDDFETEDAQVLVEKYIGRVGDRHGGRIDICITSPNGKKILIENKIYTSDKNRQLLRYYNYDKNATLLYLTLDGASSKDDGLSWKEAEMLKHAVRSISYSNDILAWLELCRKEAVSHPILRETLSQYIHLIKYLTNQTLNQNMTMEINKVISSSLNSFVTANECHQAFVKLYNQIHNATYADLYEMYDAHELSKEKIIWKDYAIVLHVAQDGDGMYFGFTATRNGQGGICREPEMLDLFNNILKEIGQDYRNTPHYIGWKYPQNVAKHLEIELVYRLNDASYRRNFVNNIIAEAEQQWILFKGKLANIMKEEHN